MRNAFGKWLLEAAKKDERLILLSGDIGFGIFDEFIDLYPNRFINCGIAEQNMIGVAAGLAASGFRPIVYTIIPFLLYRPYEFIRNLICSQNLPVMLVGVGGGFSYDSLGYTHYAIEDLTVARSLPNLQIFTPFDPVSSLTSFNTAFNTSAPTYVRLMKGGEPILESVIEREGLFRLANYGDQFLILTHGSICNEAKLACELLNIEFGIMGSVRAVTEVTNFDQSWISGFKNIFLLEEHILPGVFGDIYKNTMDADINIYPIYASNTSDFKVNNRLDILREMGMSSDAIINLIRSKYQSVT